MIDRRQALMGTLIAGLAASGGVAAPPVAQPDAPAPADPGEIIELWPHGAPGAPAMLPVEVIEERSTDPRLRDRAIHGISRPRMVVFRPAAPNGSAVLAMPGGGYRRVVVDKEGYEIGRWLAGRGYTVFVLYYRLPGDGWKAGPDVALSDAQRAMRLIRSRAKEFGIRPDRLASMGFSAGGHICGDLATRLAKPVYEPVDEADRLSARPDIAALLYAVQSMVPPLAHPGSRSLLLGANASPDMERAHSTASNVSSATPPCFLVHAEDDLVVDVANTLQFRAALKAASVPVETHLFAEGGHGFGIRGAEGKPAAIWPTLFRDWAQSHGFG